MNLAEFHFLRPYGLLALIPYAVIVTLMLRNKLSQGNWTAVCDAALLPYLLQSHAINQSRWPLIGGAFAALLTILALAGPTWDRLPSPAFRNDAALIIALDLSRSMDAGDIKPSRLTMARFKIADILKQRKDGQTALIVYAGDVFVVTPLTNDTETIASQLSALTTDIMPSEGSNANLALEKASTLFQQAGLPKGHILLVTDGVDIANTLTSVKALDNYQLSVLGVGTADGAPIALPTGGFLKDRQGAIVVPKLDAAELQQLAQAGHGTYQTLSTTDEDIKALLPAMDNTIQQSSSKTNNNLALEVWNDRGPWLLLLALPLAALSFRKGLVCLALVVLCPFPKTSYALTWQDLWYTKDQQAAQAYQSNNFTEAASTFETAPWKAIAHYKAGQFDEALAMLKNGQNSDDFYNQGNVLAQQGKLPEALKAYQKALELDPSNADAKYNKELVEKELQKQREQQQQQDQQNQQSQQDQQQNDQKSSSQEDAKNNSEKGQDPKPSDGEQSEQKPEEKPEQSAQDKSAEQQNAQPSEQDEKNAAEENANQEQKTQTAQALEQEKQDNKKQSADEKKGRAFSVEEKPYDEKQQANEQWLKRIPDDPAGLLKRKFKYQYGQQQHPAGDSADTW